MSGSGFDPMDDLLFYSSPKPFDPDLSASLGFMNDAPMVTPASTPLTTSFRSQSSDEKADLNSMSSNSLPPEFRFVSPRPPPGPPPNVSPYPMFFQLSPFSVCSSASMFPELPPIDVEGLKLQQSTSSPRSSIKSEPMRTEDSQSGNLTTERKHLGHAHKRHHEPPSRVVIPSRSYKKEIQRQSALQMQIQNIEQRRKKGTLCLGNFLFGCTADRPKVNTIRPFGRCERCLAGRSVPLQRTRMSKIKQFADEKRQTLIPGSHGQPPIRCQRYPNVFGNWALLVFATVQDAEQATRILGEVNGEPSLVQTSSVLPENVWANGVPFMRSGKYNKLVPKPIDNTSIVPPTKIMKPHLKPNELSRNIDDIAKEWSMLDQKFENLTAEQLTSPAEMDDVMVDSAETPTSSDLAFMYSLCDCGAPRCLHRFNPNSWLITSTEASDIQNAPIRWLNYEDLRADVSEVGPHYVIFSFPDYPGRSIQSDAYFVSSILSRRFEFRLPLVPEDILRRHRGNLTAIVTFRDTSKCIDIGVAPFTFIPPVKTPVASQDAEETAFWGPRTPDSGDDSKKEGSDSDGPGGDEDAMET